MKKTAAAIEALPEDDINRLERQQRLELAVDGQRVELSADDVEITSEDMPGYVVRSQGPLTVALDVQITGALREEGLARELVNRIQNLRKDKGFEVTDRIAVKLLRKEGMASFVQNNLTYLCAEILAGSFELVDSLDGETADEIEVDDHIKTLISIERI
jgi:isoleucyl-tRNA synthetase